MRKFTLHSAALALLVITLTPVMASATERLFWSGKAADGYRFTYINTHGDYWIGTTTFKGEIVPLRYREVRRCEEFIELQVEGIQEVMRSRLYKDKILYNSANTRTGWFEMGKGKWVP
jgi:hypothetical protein